MNTMEFCDLVGVDLADIHTAFVDAFSEYESADGDASCALADDAHNP